MMTMNPPAEPELPRRPLISVERQVETDIATGKTETRMFVKMYFEVRDSGLLAQMPAELWQTLCCLATYMDEHGLCYPGQARMARELGISRQQLNSRLQRLLAFRFDGRLVVTVTKRRVASSQGERFGHNLYRIQPIAGFGIFGQKPPGREPVSSPADTGPVSSPLDTGAPDTNKNHRKNKNTRGGSSQEGRSLTDHLAEALVARFHRLREHEPRKPSAKEISHAKALVAELGQARADFVLDYAIAEARRTHFEMRHFGAILQYLEEALNGYGREQARLTREAAARQQSEEEERRVAYDRWRSQEVERIRQAMPAPAIEALTEGVRERLAERAGGRQGIGFESFVGREVNHLIAESHDLPPYEVWRDQEYPWLRRLSESAS